MRGGFPAFLLAGARCLRAALSGEAARRQRDGQRAGQRAVTRSPVTRPQSRALTDVTYRGSPSSLHHRRGDWILICDDDGVHVVSFARERGRRGDRPTTRTQPYDPVVYAHEIILLLARRAREESDAMHASVADGARERKGDLEDALAAAVVKGTPTGLFKKLKDKFNTKMKTDKDGLYSFACKFTGIVALALVSISIMNDATGGATLLDGTFARGRKPKLEPGEEAKDVHDMYPLFRRDDTKGKTLTSPNFNLYLTTRGHVSWRHMNPCFEFVGAYVEECIVPYLVGLGLVEDVQLDCLLVYNRGMQLKRHEDPELVDGKWKIYHSMHIGASSSFEYNGGKDRVTRNSFESVVLTERARGSKHGVRECTGLSMSLLTSITLTDVKHAKLVSKIIDAAMISAFVEYVGEAKRLDVNLNAFGMPKDIKANFPTDLFWKRFENDPEAARAKALKWWNDPEHGQARRDAASARKTAYWDDRDQGQARRDDASARKTAYWDDRDQGQARRDDASARASAQNTAYWNDADHGQERRDAQAGVSWGNVWSEEVSVDVVRFIARVPLGRDSPRGRDVVVLTPPQR